MRHSEEQQILKIRSGCRSQQTLSRPAEFGGLSLFHGFDSSVRLLPAKEDSGIVFRRTDLKLSSDIPGTVASVRKVPRRTVLAAGDAVVETVEHLLAALSGLRVDNCVVEVNCPELPGFDGSCRPFCDSILDAGIEQQSTAANILAVDRMTCVQSPDGRQSMFLRPYIHHCAAITYHFDYGSRVAVSPQQYSVEVTPDEFYHQISPARTFVLESEIAALQKMGYGQHLTGRDLLVIGNNGPIDNSFRWPDECVRHKILDCVGDLALSQSVFHGHISATRTGHHLNHEMARILTMMQAGTANPLAKAT